MGAWVWWGYGHGNSSPRWCLLVSVALERQTDPPWAPAWVRQWAHAEQSTFTMAFSQQGLSPSHTWLFWLSLGTERNPLSLWGRGMAVNLRLGGHYRSLWAPVWAVPLHKDASCITQDPIPYLQSTPSSSYLILPLPSNNHLDRRHP